MTKSPDIICHTTGRFKPIRCQNVIFYIQFQVFLMSIYHWKMPFLKESHCNVSAYDFLFTKWIKVSNESEDFTAGYLNVCWSKVLDTFSFYYSACKFFKLVRDVIKKFLVKLKRKKVSKTDFGSLLIGCSCGKTKINTDLRIYSET